MFTPRQILLLLGDARALEELGGTSRPGVRVAEASGGGAAHEWPEGAIFKPC